MTLPPDQRPHVLLIDDEYVLLGEALRLYSTHLVLNHLTSSEHVLSCLLNLEQLPALVLLDFNVLPNNALSVLGEFRQHERTRPIPVVILSGSLQSSQVTQCYLAGANSVLLKSNNQVDLIEMTRRLCQYWFENALLPIK